MAMRKNAGNARERAGLEGSVQAAGAAPELEPAAPEPEHDESPAAEPASRTAPAAARNPLRDMRYARS